VKHHGSTTGAMTAVKNSSTLYGNVTDIMRH